MNWVAIKMLVGDRLKYIGLIAGMAFAAMMISQQASIFMGLYTQTGTFLRQLSNIDLWVMDDQVRFSEDQQPMPSTALSRVRSIEGVDWAVPMYKGWLKARLPDGTRLAVIVIGLDDATLVGGPPRMVEGKITDLRKDAAIIMHHKDADTKLKMVRAANAPLKIGDRISINDKDATIVGTFDSEPSFFWDPVIYTTYSRAISYAPPERHLTSFVLIKCKPGVDPALVQKRIEETTQYKARTGDDFLAMTSQFILEKTGILVNFGIAIGLGFVIGMLVTGQTFFNFTLDNLRYFAALKAIGTGSWTLIRMVMLQVLVVTLISFGIGVGIAALLGEIIRKTDLAFFMPWQVPVLTLGSLLLIGFLAGCLSLLKVLRLEPGVVFKA